MPPIQKNKLVLYHRIFTCEPQTKSLFTIYIMPIFYWITEMDQQLFCQNFVETKIIINFGKIYKDEYNRYIAEQYH